MTYIDPAAEPTKKKGLSGRAIGGLVIAAVVIVFIAINRDQTEVNLPVLQRRDLSLWVALTIAAVGGSDRRIPDRPQAVQAD